MAGKGDAFRPCDRVKYAEGWERTFGRTMRARFFVDAKKHAPKVTIRTMAGVLPRAKRGSRYTGAYHDIQFPTRPTPKKEPR